MPRSKSSLPPRVLLMNPSVAPAAGEPRDKDVVTLLALLAEDGRGKCMLPSAPLVAKPPRCLLSPEMGDRCIVATASIKLDVRPHRERSKKREQHFSAAPSFYSFIGLSVRFMCGCARSGSELEPHRRPGIQRQQQFRFLTLTPSNRLLRAGRRHSERRASDPEPHSPDPNLLFLVARSGSCKASHSHLRSSVHGLLQCAIALPLLVERLPWGGGCLKMLCVVSPRRRDLVSGTRTSPPQ